MSCVLRRKLVPWLALSMALLLVPHSAQAQDLADFKTVETAITTKIKKTAATKIGSPGYLGVSLTTEADGKLVISGVETNSPAAKAGLQVGDVVTKLDAGDVKNMESFRSLLQTKSAGETLQVTLERAKETMDLTATLIATSRVM